MKPKKQNTKELSTCHEVQVHYKRPIVSMMKTIQGSQDAEKFLREFIDAKRIDLKEFFWAILMTNKNQILAISEISNGSAKGVAVNVREILQLVLLLNASSIIVAHNHPSGTLKPSQADKKITCELKSVCKILEVELLDHLIITSESYISFSDSNWV